MSERVTRRMTHVEFFDWLETQERRHEVIDGVPRLMTDARRQHDRVVVRTLGLLAGQLLGGPWEPTTGNIAILIPTGNIRYPDLAVDRGYSDPDSRWAAAPVLAVEVLSPSTRLLDMIGKLEEYKTVPSLRHILLIDPDIAEATHWRRGEQGWNMRMHVGLDAAIEIDSPAVTLRLADVYSGLTLQPRPPVLRVIAQDDEASTT
jgi:Uma2 family endonuclease